MQHLKTNPWQQKQITFVFKKGELVPQAGDRAKARKEARERKALENSTKKEGTPAQDSAANDDEEAESSSGDADAPAADASAPKAAEAPSSSKSLVDSTASVVSSSSLGAGSALASPSPSHSGSAVGFARQSASLDSVVSAAGSSAGGSPADV
jgi:hypothetical protein